MALPAQLSHMPIGRNDALDTPLLHDDLGTLPIAELDLPDPDCVTTF